MSDPRIEEVFVLVSNLTSARKLRWTVSPNNSATFIADIDPYRILLTSNGLSYSFYVMNKTGIQIGSIVDNTMGLNPLHNVLGSGVSGNGRVKKLFEFVKTQTLGGDLDDLLKKLRGL